MSTARSEFSVAGCHNLPGAFAAVPSLTATSLLPSCVLLRAVVVPERFIIDARQIQVEGGSLAERPVDGPVGGSAGAVGADAGTTLGQGCFGKVTSMSHNGAPVAVKELSATTLDSASLGEWMPLNLGPGTRALKLSSCSSQHWLLRWLCVEVVVRAGSALDVTVVLAVQRTS